VSLLGGGARRAKKKTADHEHAHGPFGGFLSSTRENWGTRFRTSSCLGLTAGGSIASRRQARQRSRQLTQSSTTSRAPPASVCTVQHQQTQKTCPRWAPVVERADSGSGAFQMDGRAINARLDAHPPRSSTSTTTSSTMPPAGHGDRHPRLGYQPTSPRGHVDRQHPPLFALAVPFPLQSGFSLSLWYLSLTVSLPRRHAHAQVDATRELHSGVVSRS